jgi:hypothetical protein
MRTRHLGRALVGLVAAAATIGLLGLPASAHCVSATGEIIDGDITIINSSSEVLDTINLDGTEGVTCTESAATLKMDDLQGPLPHTPTTTGTWKATQTSSTGIQIGTQWFKSDLVITFAPNTNTTWVSAYSGTVLTATGGFADATLTKSTATTPCVPLTTGACTIEVRDITVDNTSTHTVSPTPDIEDTDSAVVDGGTNVENDLGFEVAVTGGATACGSLLGADDGAVTFSDVTIDVISVP